ncbi:RND efflux system outer membrane lipoprotein [Sphingomonas sp. LH128]|nr:RND efflux system outer membrane lipoprotein [Sphingomonas sp. LH128]
MQAQPVSAGWWRTFASAELDNLMDRAFAGNFMLAAAEARIRQAQGRALIAGAAVNPSLQIGGYYVEGGRTVGTTARRVTAQASYEIDFWGANAAARGSANANVQASAADAATVAMTLSAQVAESYFTALSLRERIEIASDMAREARAMLRLVEIQQRSGTATLMQVRQQETIVAGLDGQVSLLEQQLQNTVHALAVLVGMSPQGFALAPAKLDDVVRPSFSEDPPARLLTARPDIRAAEARLVAANFDVGAARAAFLPNLSLSGEAGIATASTARVFPLSLVAGIGGAMLAPVFQGGRLKGQMQMATARQDELIADYRQAILGGFRDAQDALSGLTALRRQEAAANAALAAAAQADSLARLQYRLGSSDYLTVLTTQQALYRARDTSASIRLDHLLGIVSLCRALGGGMDEQTMVRSALAEHAAGEAALTKEAQ